MDSDARSQRRTCAAGEDCAEDRGDHRQYPGRRGFAASLAVDLAATCLPASARVGSRAESCSGGREEVEELADDHSGCHHVCQWQHDRWTASIPEERAGGAQGPERVRYLLQCHLDGHADAEQALRDV